ncbi:MAG: DNA repair protein RadC [Methanosarcinales archaeon]|nr:MAG: DNA repair protein RadC [Methanosarcinales archaeon]
MSRPFDKIPKHERPREKLLARGARALNDQELLAILIGKGTLGMDVMTLAGKLVKVVDEKGLELHPDDLVKFNGIGDAKATLILAAIEFARRRIKPEGTKIETPADVLPLIRHYADRKQEHFISTSINGANEVMNIRVVSIGLVDSTSVHPREVFADAMTDRASGVIVAHNHPAGSLEPSAWDVEVTKQLKAAGEVVGVALLDHIIFNRTGYYSFLESGKF